MSAGNVGSYGRAWMIRSVLMLLVMTSLACGASSHFDGHVYKNGALVYRVGEPPASWRGIDVPEANLAFRDSVNDASVLVNGRCTSKDKDTPLVSLTHHLVIGTTDREPISQETIPFDAREALHTVLVAKLDGVKMQYDIYVLKKDGCVYDFVYVAAPERFAQGAPGFERFVQSFKTLGPGAP